MIQIQYHIETDDPLPMHSDSAKQVVTSVLESEGITDGNVNIILTNDERVRQLKKQFFDIDVFTDVISFNLEDEGEHLEGEIYISWDRVIENASTFKVSNNNELKRIIIHGILHLCGYDDQTPNDKKKMQELENKYLEVNNISIINI
jgi:rRNA maturation RNase YbeY